jgi:hypothetical protein
MPPIAEDDAAGDRHVKRHAGAADVWRICLEDLLGGSAWRICLEDLLDLLLYCRVVLEHAAPAAACRTVGPGAALQGLAVVRQQDGVGARLFPPIKASLPASERPKSKAVFGGFWRFSVAPPLLSARWRALGLRSPGAATTPALRAVCGPSEPSKQSTAAD